MRILVPLDGSRLADAVVAHVVALVQRDRSACEVHLLRAIDADPAAHAEARVHLVALSHLLASLSFRVTRHIVTGAPVTAILEHVAGNGIDLVAMATHGRSGISRWIRGSVAEGVVRGCGASVLLVNPHGLALEGEDLRYRRLLLPIDASTVVEDAAPLVIALAATAGASVALLGLGDAARPLVEQARRTLEGRGVTLGTITTTAGLPSDPAANILAACRGRAADLVILCSGPGALPAPWPVGQAEDQVTRDAPCAVLLLRTPAPRLDARA